MTDAPPLVSDVPLHSREHSAMLEHVFSQAEREDNNRRVHTTMHLLNLSFLIDQGVTLDEIEGRLSALQSILPPLYRERAVTAQTAFMIEMLREWRAQPTKPEDRRAKLSVIEGGSGPA